MRDYGKVHSAIWSSTDFLSYSDDGKLLVFYLLTSTHTTITGAFRLPDGYLCADLNWPVQRVSKGLQELFKKGFCNRCETTKWLYIRKFLQWNPPENPNQWKAVAKQAVQIPKQCAWKPDFMRVLAALHDAAYPDRANPFETLSKPETETVTETVTGTEDLLGDESPDAEPVGPTEEEIRTENFERLWAKRPPRAGNDPKHEARKAFNARMDDGEDIAEIENGLERYCRFVEATGKANTEYVMRMSTFLGPSKNYLQDWSPPKALPARGQLENRNEAAIQEALRS